MKGISKAHFVMHYYAYAILSSICAKRFLALHLLWALFLITSYNCSWPCAYFWQYTGWLYMFGKKFVFNRDLQILYFCSQSTSSKESKVYCRKWISSFKIIRELKPSCELKKLERNLKKRFNNNWKNFLNQDIERSLVYYLGYMAS